MQIKQLLEARLSRHGFEIRRTLASRRQYLLTSLCISEVVDVGAAVGNYGRELREHGYAGRIISFEPLDRSFAILASLARKDGQWDALRLAVGREHGSAEINVADSIDASSLLPALPALAAAAPQAAYVGKQRVELVRLDDVLVATDHRYLKIDTQGFEAAVLDGARATLEKAVGVELEVSFEPLYEGGLTYLEAFERMDSAGFRPAHFNPGLRDSGGTLLQADVIFVRRAPHLTS